MLTQPSHQRIANPHPVVLNPRSTSPEDLGVQIPYNFTPRDYQEEDLFRPLFPHHYPDLRLLSMPPKKRILAIWHRRAGKDKSLINAITLAAWETVGNYLYLLPEQTQAKKIIWRGIDGSGFRFLDHIPDGIVKNKFASELLIELSNGSTIQIGGSDNYDSWMGTNPRGIVFSEYSLQDPMAWQYFRPILVENGGWAIFNYTTRGKNHGYDLYKTALNNPDTWHVSVKSIKDTRRPDGHPVVTHEQYLQEIAEGMPEAIARQEFYCDWDAALMGSYYGDLLATAQAEDRIGHFPYDPKKKVYTGWDIGLDATAVWFAQYYGSGLQLIDYFEESNTRFTDCVKAINEKPYDYGAHFGPHDLKHRNPEMVTRIDTAADLGVEFVVTPRLSLSEGIEAARALIPRCSFNYSTTERGLDALKSYERVYDERLQRFREQPIHNWASHGADGFRTLALNWQDDMGGEDWLNKELTPDLRGFI